MENMASVAQFEILAFAHSNTLTPLAHAMCIQSLVHSVLYFAFGTLA